MEEEDACDGTCDAMDNRKSGSSSAKREESAMSSSGASTSIGVCTPDGLEVDAADERADPFAFFLELPEA